MSRVIGISHRVKVIVQKDKPAEMRPTKVAIAENGKVVAEHTLETETDELDFLLGRFPVAFRPVEAGEDLSGILKRHIEWRKTKEGEDLDALPESHKRLEGKTTVVAAKVPRAYDGMRTGDIMLVVLSGSGNRLAYAASRRADEIGAEVYDLPGFKLRTFRNEPDKSDYDHEAMIEAFRVAPEEFYRMMPRDRDLVALKEAYVSRVEAVRARIAGDQRFRARYFGFVFCNSEGRYPEGEIEDAYELAKTNDAVLRALYAEEKLRDKDLVKAIEQVDVYTRLFEPIEGVGPAIAARLITAIGDIRQFATDAKLKKYCGVHVMEDGRFPRRRNGELANWKPDCRQALFLLGDQFNRRPNSVWGKKLREYKEKLRAAHPNPVLVVGKGEDVRFYELVPDLYEQDKRSGVYTILTDEGEVKVKGTLKYTPAHIHKMAVWRTLTKFVEWLWKEWWAIENMHSAAPALDRAANE